VATADRTELSLDVPHVTDDDGGRARPAGLSPGRLALRRLRRNTAALAFGVLFVVLVGACIAAPLWAEHVAHTTPSAGHLSATIEVNERGTFGQRLGRAFALGIPGSLSDIEGTPEQRQVVSLDGVPTGPTWEGEFFLGADPNGRDIMVRLLYGGRNSLMIGVFAALVSALLSIVLGLAAGYFRGAVDAVISRMLDVMWSFPVIILGVALGVSLAQDGLDLGLVTIDGNSLAIPILVISIVYVPYMARPLRGQVLALREKEFVEAARAQGASAPRIMFTEILPNLASTILVFSTLLVANAVLLEAALSFLGAGVRPPEPSWGTMIDEGVERIATAPHLAIVPGAMLVMTVLSLNVFGDGVRDALDPRAKVRIEH
jgi:peptide/nickel transport system permease protein